MTTSLLADAPDCTACLPRHNWQPSIEPRGITNGYRQGVGGELFVPIRQNGCSLFFGQALGGRFQEEWVGALGLGYRRLFPSCTIAWGVNGFIDGIQADRMTYGQGGVGAELLGPCWEGRINGYFPFKRVEELEHHQSTSLGLEGRALIQQTSGYCIRERTYAGFDVEGGYGRNICWGSLWGYAGYYYFDTDVLETIQGPRLRLVYRYDGLLSSCASQLIAGLLYEYDRVHGNRVGVEVGIRIPLGHLAKSACCPSSSLLRRMGNRIVRQEGILRRCERHNDPLITTGLFTEGGVIREVFFVRQGPLGSGTQSDPTNLADALDQAKEGATLVVSRSGGDLKTEGIVLKEGMHLFGFGESGAVHLHAESLVLRLEDPAGRVALVGPSKGSVVTLASDASVTGVCIEGGSVAIKGEGIERAKVENVHIARASDYGVQLQRASEVTLSSVTMSRIGDWLLVAENAPDLCVRHLTASDRVDNGIKISSSDSACLEELQLQLGGDVGMQIVGSQNIAVKRALIDGSVSTHKLDYGIALKETKSVLLDQVSLKGVDGYALLAQQCVGTNAIKLDANTKADEAIRVVGGEHFSLRQSTINGAKEALVVLYDVTGNLILTDNVLDDAQSGRRSSIELISYQDKPINLVATRNKIRHAEGGGVKVDVQAGATLNATFTQNTLTGLGGVGFLCIQNDSASDIDVTATNNTFTGVKGAMALRTGSYASDSSFNYLISNNTLDQVSGTGILIAHEAFSKGPAKLTGTLSHNTLSEVSGPGIHLFSDVSKGPDHLFAPLVRSNQFRAMQQEAIRIEVDHDSGGDVHLKLLDNQDVAGASGSPYALTIGQGHKGVSTLNMSGQRSTREGALIDLNDRTGNLQVANVDRLSEENSGLPLKLN